MTQRDRHSAKGSALTLTNHPVSAFLLTIAGYFVLGLVGLQLQSAQTGVTPVWPASGFAFAMVYWFGLWNVLAILPAMLGLAVVLGIPLEAALLSAGGAMLEVGVPAWLLRRQGFDPTLRYLRDVMLFVAVGPVLGATLAATTGVAAFRLLGGSSFDPVGLWLLWWLGNSIGFLLGGAFGLVAVARRSMRIEGRRLWELLAASLTAVAITAAGLLQIETVSSPLVMFLLIPVFVLIAQRGDQLPVAILGISVMLVMLLSAAWLPIDSYQQAELGILYLDISLLWVVTFTAMVVCGGRQEMRTREHATWLADHDHLTRLLNRHAFMRRLERCLAKHAAGRTGHVLMFLDLDRFKNLNDAEGHRAGDQVLREVAVMMGQEVRAVDSIARLGGDEFAVALEDCPLLDACSIAENIRGQIERYEYRGEHGVHRVEVSVGMVVLADRHATPEDALHDADSACYAAKRGGRNRVWVFAEDAVGTGARG